MRKNFTPEQMLHTVRQAESGTPVDLQLIAMANLRSDRRAEPFLTASVGVHDGPHQQ